jgi:hypothetical protein
VGKIFDFIGNGLYYVLGCVGYLAKLVNVASNPVRVWNEALADDPGE